MQCAHTPHAGVKHALHVPQRDARWRSGRLSSFFLFLVEATYTLVGPFAQMRMWQRTNAATMMRLDSLASSRVVMRPSATDLQ